MNDRSRSGNCERVGSRPSGIVLEWVRLRRCSPIASMLTHARSSGLSSGLIETRPYDSIAVAVQTANGRENSCRLQAVEMRCFAVAVLLQCCVVHSCWVSTSASAAAASRLTELAAREASNGTFAAAAQLFKAALKARPGAWHLLAALHATSAVSEAGSPYWARLHHSNLSQSALDAAGSLNAYKVLQLSEASSRWGSYHYSEAAYIAYRAYQIEVPSPSNIPRVPLRILGEIGAILSSAPGLSHFRAAGYPIERLSFNPEAFLIRGLLRSQEAEHLSQLLHGSVAAAANGEQEWCMRQGDNEMLEHVRAIVSELMRTNKLLGSDIQFHAVTYSNNQRFSCAKGEFSRHLNEAIPPASVSASFETGHDHVIDAIEARVAMLTGWGERTRKHYTQILQYKGDHRGKYALHTDCFDFFGDHSGGSERSHTLLAYVQNVRAGGSTVFPHLKAGGVKVVPRAGDAVVFANLHSDGRCNPDSAHEAQKVELGEKIILQRWYCTDHTAPGTTPFSCGSSDHPREVAAQSTTCDGVDCRMYVEPNLMWSQLEQIQHDIDEL